MKSASPKSSVPFGARCKVNVCRRSVDSKWELLFVSGHIAKRGGEPWTGQLGSSLTTSIGTAAVRAAAEDVISTLHAATHDLGAIEQVLKLVVLVNSTATFTDYHLVANGAWDLMTAVFGKVGNHVRTVCGVAQLPYGACVEIEATSGFAMN